MRRDNESALPPLWVITSLSVVCLVWLALQLKELLVLLIIGYFVAYAIDPLLGWFERRGISRRGGFAIVCAIMVSVLSLLALTALPAIIDEFYKLTGNLSRYLEIGRERLGPYWSKVTQLAPFLGEEEGDLVEMLARLPHLVSEFNADGIKRVFGAVGNTLMKGYDRALALVNIALLPLIIYYLALDLPRIHSRIADLVPITRRARFVSIFREIDIYLSAFVRGQVIVCTLLFLLYAIGLGAVGVDLWLLLAAISGFGNVIPYVGFLVGIVLSSLMALVTFGDFTHLLIVWIVYAIVQALEGTLITPKVMGDSVGLSPLVIILALFAGGQLCGLLGIFLAVPAAATLRVVISHYYRWVMGR